MSIFSKVAKITIGGKVHNIDLNEQLQEMVPYLSRDFAITAVTQRFSHERSDHIPLHWHSEFQISWIYKGILEYQINDKTIHCRKDSILFINQHQFHSSKTVNDDCEILCLNFSLEFLHPKLVETYITPIIDNNRFSFELISLSPEQKNKLNNILTTLFHKTNYFALANFIIDIFNNIIEKHD